jgi:hypothetical protein
MDQTRNRLSQDQDHSPGSSLLGHAHRWAGGALLLAALVGCEVVPDRVGVGAGRSFADGSHLASSRTESYSSLYNDRNDDIDTVWIYGEWDLKPQKVEFVTAPRAWSYLDDLPPREVQTIYPPQEPEPPVEEEQDPVGLLKEGLEVLEETSTSTFEKLMWLIGGLALLGVVFFGLRIVIKKKG